MGNERIHHIRSSNELKGDYILYWMQQSQRITFNYALNLGIILSNLHGIPLVVYFGLTEDYPDANQRHYKFMLEGLEYLKHKFVQMGIKFVIYRTSPEIGCIKLMQQASHLIMDTGYTRIQKSWKQTVVENALKINTLNILEVESDVLVPVRLTSEKEEYAARTIRPKILSQIEAYIAKPKDIFPHFRSLHFEIKTDMEEIKAPMEILDVLKLDRTISLTNRFIGGEDEAIKMFHEFIHYRLPYYLDRNHPEFDYCSYLSPYLHFGHISPIKIVYHLKKLLKSNSELDLPIHSLIEELVVRRELAINFVNYNEHYDDFHHMTYAWAYDTMLVHKDDPREYLYTLSEFEQYQTHDIYWNTAMKEMVHTGFMHTYMRMYWCKKIIEWSPDYETAYDIALYLNNKYFLDGRDPNSYAGIAWCFGKHDRAWTERPVFGKLRYMNANGLKRKFDIDKYVEKINALTEGD
jgi:deoxyribodipyrimidine photo-lyase